MPHRDAPAADSRPLSASEVRARLELLSELGYGLLESGLTSAQTTRELARHARALGLGEADFSAFGRMLSIEKALDDGTTVSVTGTARALDLIDCTRSKALVEVAERAEGGGARTEVGGGRTRDGGEPEGGGDPEADCGRTAAGSASEPVLAEARAELRRLRDTAAPGWAVALGMTMLAFFISMQVGVSWRAWVAAAALQILSSGVGFTLGGLRPPKVLTIAVQSSAAGAFATLLVQLDFVDPVGAAVAIAVNWLLLLPLPQVIGAVTDAVEADYISALSRVASVGMAALGIFIGGAFTFTLGEALGMEHPRLDSLPSLPWYLVLVFSALGAIANAFANGGRAPLVMPAAGLGLVTGAVSQALLLVFGVPVLWASSFAALVLGVVSTFIAARTGYPQQVLALMGITGALLPGIPVFFGILQEMGGGTGLGHFAHAAAICLGIGTGVALGSYLAGLGMRDRSSGSGGAVSE
ncbi:threonine/serine exporter family protein [Leucobacter tenebrionis]|uniref:threonine/serine exporter family protein n=1 Tax=Leucobacter tenebrionis TaxID=2873270 RepID=UPI001CA688B4|nr:threonine/serine exporter family protein [Leucobacter tenebrionis]QZY51963.1 threonine/serine exporter family protein [Leucobacter tenebrionis]